MKYVSLLIDLFIISSIQDDLIVADCHYDSSDKQQITVVGIFSA